MEVVHADMVDSFTLNLYVKTMNRMFELDGDVDDSDSDTLVGEDDADSDSDTLVAEDGATIEDASDAPTP